MSCEDLCTGDEAGIYTYCLGVRSVLMHTRSHNNALGQCRDTNYNKLKLKLLKYIYDLLVASYLG